MNMEVGGPHKKHETIYLMKCSRCLSVNLPSRNFLELDFTSSQTVSTIVKLNNNSATFGLPSASRDGCLLCVKQYIEKKALTRISHRAHENTQL